MPLKISLAAVASGLILLAFGVPEERGKELFDRRCAGCHAPDLNKEGPRLRGVYGRHAAAVPEFVYSEALKKANLDWDDANLNRWLADPDAMAPNTDMAFRVASEDERKVIIAYLKSLKIK